MLNWSFIRRCQPGALAAAALIALSLVPVVPLFLAARPWSADANQHLYRLVEFEALLRHGLLYPRWAPDLGYGYGFPLFNFYPPLAYYLGAGLRWLSGDSFLALKLAFAVAFLSAGFGAFWLARYIGGETAGWVAAAAYLFSPYLLLNALQRGNLPESLAMGLAPWSVLGFIRLARVSRPRGLLLPALVTAAVGYTHTLSFALLLAVVGALALFLWVTTPIASGTHQSSGRIRLGLHLAAALGLALVLTGAYWLPAAAELRYVQSERLTPPPGFDYHANFVALGQLLTLPRPADPLMVSNTTGHFSYSLALPAVLLAALGLYVPRRAPQSRLSPFFWLCVLVAVALMHPIAVGIWDGVTALQVFQFPWRLLAPSSLALAVLAGFGLARLRSRWLLGGIVLVLGLWVLTWTFVPAGDLPLPPRLDVSALTGYEVAAGHIGATSNADYLPLAVEQMPTPKPAGEIVDRALLPAGTQLTTLEYEPYRARLQFDLPAPGRLIYNQFVFPGWSAKLDGQPVPIAATAPTGLIAVDLPAGQHDLEITLHATAAQRLGYLLSALGVAACLLVVGLDRRRAAASQPPTATAGNGLPGTWAPVLLAVGVALAVRLYLQDRSSIFYGTRLHDGVLAGVGLPVTADFDSKLRLLGADLESAQPVAGSELAFTLYWQALQPLDTVYSVTTVLVDEQGARVAQHDIEHPGGLPATTWTRDHYVADPHRMRLPADLRPGSYTLWVGVYRRDDQGLLPLHNAPGQVMQALTQIQVRRPFVAPDPDNVPMDVRLPVPAQYDGFELLGYSALPASVRVGEDVPFQLFWRARSGGRADWRVEILLRSSPVAQSPASGSDRYLSTQWAAGEIVRGTFTAPVSVLLPAGPAELAFRLVTADGLRTLAPLTLGTILVSVPSHTDQVPPIAHPLTAGFGSTIELLGYDLRQSATQLALTLYWRSLTPAEANYSVFVHLLDSAGSLRAQTDRPPLSGARPTRGWIPGEVLSDPITLDWPAGLPGGAYTVSVGLYDPRTGERLPVGSSDALALAVIHAPR